MLYRLFYNTFRQGVRNFLINLLTEVASGPQFTTVEFGSLLGSPEEGTCHELLFITTEAAGPHYSTSPEVYSITCSSAVQNTEGYQLSKVCIPGHFPTPNKTDPKMTFCSDPGV